MDITAQRKDAHHRGRNICILLAVILIAGLVAARLYLPIWLKDYVNGVLNRIDGYTGSVEAIDVHLYRGAYTIHTLNLNKNGAGAPAPFLHIDSADLSLQWGALFQGRIVSDVHLNKPELNFIINGGTKVQTGQDVDWTKPIKDLMPIDINLVEIIDGKISYRDYSASPDVNIYINNLLGTLTNLRNITDATDALPSKANFTGTSIGGGALTIQGRLNILRPTPDMDLDLTLENADLTSINDLANAHAGLDFVRGNLSVYSELAVKNDEVRGYVKPIATNIEVVDHRQDTNPLEYIWESLASIVIEILENQPRDQFATRVPLEGRLDGMETNGWEAFLAILRNAFVQAFQRNTDGSIDFFFTDAGGAEDAPDAASPAAAPIPRGIRR